MSIELAKKYSKKVQERFYAESVTQSAFSKDLDMEFDGVKSVRVYEVGTAPMNNYTRSGSNRYGTPAELQDNVYEFTMNRDRSYAYTIDRGNQEEQVYIKAAGATLDRQIREVVTPEIDAYRLGVWATNAGQHVAVANAPTKSTIVGMMLDANSALNNKHVPKKGRTFFVKESYYKALKLSDEFIAIQNLGQKSVANGTVGTIDGVPVKTAADSDFPANVYFMLIYKRAAISPMKLQSHKIHKDPPGISGWLVEGRVIYDAFVKPTMADGIYACCASGTVCTKPTLAESSGTVTVTLQSGETGKYTTDGSDPRFSETAKDYDSGNKPTITSGQTIKVAAVKSGSFWSELAELSI